MSEKVKVLTQRDVEVLLWNAMCESTKGSEILTKFGIVPNGLDTEVDVKVTVNGVEVPFIEEVGRFLSQYRDHVKNEAKRMVRKCVVDTHLDTVEEALSELIEHIRDADKDITDKLCCVLGKERS